MILWPVEISHYTTILLSNIFSFKYVQNVFSLNCPWYVLWSWKYSNNFITVKCLKIQPKVYFFHAGIFAYYQPVDFCTHTLGGKLSKSVTATMVEGRPCARQDVNIFSPTASMPFCWHAETRKMAVSATFNASRVLNRCPCNGTTTENRCLSLGLLKKER